MQRIEISCNITWATGLGESPGARAAAAGLVIKGLVGSGLSSGFRGLMSALSSAFSVGRCFGFGEVEAEGVLELEKMS